MLAERRVSGVVCRVEEDGGTRPARCTRRSVRQEAYTERVHGVPCLYVGRNKIWLAYPSKK